MRWLAVLVAAIGMSNIRTWSASSSSVGQSPATSSTAKLMLWLHGGCYRQQNLFGTDHLAATPLMHFDSLRRRA